MTLMASEIIVKPVISEKSMDETQRGKYTFRVHIDANKLMVKEAIETLFNVDVVNVNVSTSKAKEKSRNRRRGRQIGWTSPWKKAVVTLAAGQKIEFFEGV
jgi:large subunit ribosomal protein L23